jgi:hypothetical protein
LARAVFKDEGSDAAENVSSVGAGGACGAGSDAIACEAPRGDAPASARPAGFPARAPPPPPHPAGIQARARLFFSQLARSGTGGGGRGGGGGAAASAAAGASAANPVYNLLPDMLSALCREPVGLDFASARSRFPEYAGGRARARGRAPGGPPPRPRRAAPGAPWPGPPGRAATVAPVRLPTPRPRPLPPTPQDLGDAGFRQIMGELLPYVKVGRGI